MFKAFIVSFCFLSILQIKAQNNCSMDVDEKTNKPMAIGLCDRNIFSDTSFAVWFESEYQNYIVDTFSVNLVKKELNTLKIKIVLGTWCSDSREQVPRFLKILDFINFPSEQLSLLFVNRKKQASDFDISDLDIVLVPTIIYYNNDIEMGRITETPEISLEEDTVDIIFSNL